MDTLELTLHPVRLRIVHAMAGGRTRTTSQLCEALPDVPKATMYRHVSLLVDGDLLEVVGEERVHGAVERTYRLIAGSAVVGRDAAAAMSVEDHRRGFAVAMASLVAEFNAYLDRGDAVPIKDSVSYIQAALWLNRAERARLVESIRTMITSVRDNTAGRGRRPFVLSPILFPIGDEPPQR
jgi:DNA-binding transcriptional ArsR family regulator